MTRLFSPSSTPQHRVRIAIVLAAVALYVLAFKPLYAVIGNETTVLTILLSALSGWLFGRRLGIYAAIATIPINIFLYRQVGIISLTTMLSPIPTYIASIVVGWVSGWMSDLVRTLKQQANELDRGREAFQEEIGKNRPVETQLRQSKQQYEPLLGNSPYPIWVIDPRTLKFLSVNDAATQFFGYSEKEFLSMTLKDLYPAEVIPILLDEIKSETSIRKNTGTWSHRKKDGTIIDVNIIVHSLMLGDNPVRIVLALDGTERNRAEEALRASEAELRALFTSMNVLILVLDASGRYLKIASTNPSLLYRPSDELMGKRLHDVFPHEQADFFLSHIQRTLETRETVNFEYDLRIAGRDLWFSSTISPLTDTSVIWVARDITERKQSESALRESEARFRALTDSTASAIFIYQSDKIRYVNHTVETLTGYSRNELSGIKFWDLVHPDFRDLVRERGLARQRGESVPPRYEFKMITKTGEERWLDFTAGIIEYDGTPALVGTAFDITDRKRSEEIQSAVYRISQTADIAVNLDDLFRLIHGIIQEVMPAQNFYIALYDEQEDVVSFPYFVDEVDEPSPPHKLGRGLTEYVLRTGKSLLCDEAMDRELLRRGEVELVGVSSPVWLGVPLIIEEKPIGVMVVQHYSDEKAYGASEQQILEFVSSQVAKAIDRKRRQEALAIQQSYFQHLFENSPAGIVIMNEADLVINVNKAFEHIFQYTIDEIRGVNLNELIVPESYLEEAFELSMKPQQRQITQRETVRKRRDGTLVNVSFTGYPIVLENELVGITGMYIDITERTQLEDQLRQAQKLESLGTLAGGIAHDFNNILGIILGHASILSSAKQDPMKLSHSIDVIAKASERGAGLVRQLLTFARKTDVLLESVRVNDTVNEVVNLLRQTFPKTIAITVQLEDRLPSIIADANQLHQVLLNLSVNARDAMPSGGTLQMTTALIAGSVVRTKYTKATDTEYVLIQVADSGVGMDEATRSRVFEPFFTTKELGKGTGLGLASVYGIVESHSAFIDVESELRRGTSFNLYFPVHPRGMTIPEMKEVVREEIPGGNETILVVEDEEMLQELVKSILSRKGYETLIAGDGEAAVSLYVQKHHEIAAVLSDLGLPKLGGRDVFLRLKETNPAVKVIIASGYMEPTIKNEMFKAGVKGFIQKPYVPDEILKKIRHVLDQHNA